MQIIGPSLNLSSVLLIIFGLHSPLTAAGNFISIYSSTSFDEAANMTKPGLPSKCGDLTVPYPFGIRINSSCSIHPLFDIYCDASSDPPRAFIGSNNFEVLGISKTKLRVKNSPAVSCYDQYGDLTKYIDSFMDLSSTPFSFSTDNRLTVVGCDDVALMSRYGSHDPWGDHISPCVLESGVARPPNQRVSGSSSSP